MQAKKIWNFGVHTLMWNHWYHVSSQYLFSLIYIFHTYIFFHTFLILCSLVSELLLIRKSCRKWNSFCTDFLDSFFVLVPIFDLVFHFTTIFWLHFTYFCKKCKMKPKKLGKTKDQVKKCSKNEKRMQKTQAKRIPFSTTFFELVISTMSFQ